MFNVGPPLPCQMYFLIVYTMVHATYRALNPVLGERAVATGYVTASASGHGTRPDGLDGSLVDSAGPAVIGAWGATRHGDADSSQQSSLGNLINDGVEIHELRGPIVWAASDYVPDSAGAGRHRGGAAIVHDTLWRVPAAHTMQLLFHARRPTAGGGVNGGGSGPTTTAWIFDAEISDDGTPAPGAALDAGRGAVPRRDAVRRRRRPRHPRGRPRRRAGDAPRQARPPRRRSRPRALCRRRRVG